MKCDTTIPANVEWLSPEGVVVSNESILEIMNIQMSAAGTYTCVSANPLSGATINNTVNVTVQCEYYESICNNT